MLKNVEKATRARAPVGECRRPERRERKGGQDHVIASALSSLRVDADLSSAATLTSPRLELRAFAI
jgi:hypothetical protein